jgi:hypothetical protein
MSTEYTNYTNLAAEKFAIGAAGSETDITASAAELNIMDGVTATAAELNKTDGIAASGYLMVQEDRTFTETAGAGTFTATVVIPAGSTVYDVIFRNTVAWNSETSATLDAGDADDPNGYFAAVDVKALTADTATVPGSISVLQNDTGAGAYGGLIKFYPTAGLITAAIVKVGTTGTAGRSRLSVIYGTPTAVAATKA